MEGTFPMNIVFYSKIVLLSALLMALVVLASNLLVSYPLDITFLGQHYEGWFTYATFTFPFAFLITDIVNRSFGPRAARKVVLVGFLTGVLMSLIFGDVRIGIASGAAFFCSQILDVWLFDRLRYRALWQAPLLSSFIASFIDTVLFYTLAFAAIFGLPEGFTGWQQVALGDFCVKVIMALVLLPLYILVVTQFLKRYYAAPGFQLHAAR